MTVSATLQATIATSPNAYVAAQTVVAIPPSDLDSADQMRGYVGGILTLRDYDPGVAVVTGAPIAFVTEDGEDLLTETDEPITTEVS